jgi:hypothetical protein
LAAAETGLGVGFESRALGGGKTVEGEKRRDLLEGFMGGGQP